MFHGDRWAGVFLAVLGENAVAGLACLRALVGAVASVPGVPAGYPAARRLEKALREGAVAAGCVGGGGPDTGAAVVETVVRFIILLVEKRRFARADAVMRQIEGLLDERRGVRTITLEAAAPPDERLVEELRRGIAERTGATEVRLVTRPVPELLEGYRLRIGAFLIDASLKTRVERMRADLEAAALGYGTAPLPPGEGT